MRARWLRRLAVGLVVLVALVAVVGFWVVPPLARSQLEKQLSQHLLRPAKVAAVQFNPFDLRLAIVGLEVADHDAPRLLAFDELVVDVEARALLTGRIAFEEIRLVRPFVRVTLERAGRLNVSDVIDAASARAAAAPPEPEPPASAESAPPEVRIARLEIAEGTFDFLDRSRATPFATTLTPLQIVLTDFSTERDRNSPYAFEARFDQDTRLAWTGDFSVNPVRSSGKVALEGLHLASLAPYLRDVMQLEIRRGALSVSASYRVDASSKALDAAIADGRVEVKALEVGAPARAEPVLALDRIAVDGIAVDVAKRTVRTGSVALAGPSVVVARAADGAIDLAAWAQPPSASAAPVASSTAAAPPSAAVASSAAAAPGAAPWSVRVAGLALRDGRVRFTDHGTATPLALDLDRLTLDTAPLTVPLGPELALRLGLRVNGKGTIRAEGTVPLGAAPLSLKLGVDDLELAIAQPFVAPLARVAIASGTLATHGQLTLRDGRTSYRGDFAVRKLAVRETEADRDVVSLDELSLAGLELALAPTVVNIDTVRLAGLRTKMIVNPDGSTNYGGLAIPAKPSAAPPSSPAPASKEPEPTATIGALVLDGIRAEYLDRSLSPPFRMELGGFGGRIAPIRWPANRAARLDLKGRVDAAPLTVTGTVLPAGKRATLELAIKLQGLDLIPASTYSSKFAGYPVAKGKLSLDLAYALADRKVTGKNLIVVDQLTLGDKVESPDATWLPVKLGLAILTDKNGRMELDLPVGGDLDDPEFGLGKIIVRALVNVLEKVATSPFALLGAVVGGSDEPPPDRVVFTAGSSAVDASGDTTIARLGQALADRPALRLSVGGTYDGASDGAALARARLEAKIKDDLRRGGAATPVVDEAAWTARVRKLYGTRSATRAPTFAEMEAAVLAGETPSAAELRALADARAQAVQAKLVTTIGAERVFVAVPQEITSADRAVILRIE